MYCEIVFPGQFPSAWASNAHENIAPPRVASKFRNPPSRYVFAALSAGQQLASQEQRGERVRCGQRQPYFLGCRCQGQVFTLNYKR